VFPSRPSRQSGGLEKITDWRAFMPKKMHMRALVLEIVGGAAGAAWQCLPTVARVISFGSV
jgi:hypothetical protein